MSTKTVADKLLIKPETTIWSSHPSRLDLIEPLPDGVRIVDRPDEAATALIFADDAASAEQGMRPISQVAIDNVWSALRFRRLKDGEPPFTGGQ